MCENVINCFNMITNVYYKAQLILSYEFIKHKINYCI